MTTMREALAPTIAAEAPEEARAQAGGARVRVRARLATTAGDSKSLRRAVAVARLGASIVVSDVANAWPWAGTPPTLADLWATRVPDIERVPGGSRGLQTAWAVFNHVGLALTAPGYVALWVCAHPARFLLAVVLAVPVLLMWI